MKKLVLTTLAVVGVSSLAFAQGYINWTTTPGANVIGATGSNYTSLASNLGQGGSTGAAQAFTAGSGTTVYYYELMYSSVDTATPTTLTDLEANWSPTGLYLENGTTANGRAVITGSSTSAEEIDPSYTGGNLGFMLVGWSANLGTTWAGSGQVESTLNAWPAAAGVNPAYFGLSSVGVQPISTSSTAGTSVIEPVPGTDIYNPSSAPLVLSELAVVPEPGTLALAALGGFGLLMFRRKK